MPGEQADSKAGTQIKTVPRLFCMWISSSINTKDIYKQLQKNPKIALTSMGKGGTWIRVTGTAVRDDNDESRRAMLADPTGPSDLYTIGDGIFEVLRIENAHAVQYSFTADPVEIRA